MIYYYEFLSFFFSLIHLSLALDFLKFLWVETISDAFLFLYFVYDSENFL